MWKSPLNSFNSSRGRNADRFAGSQRASTSETVPSFVPRCYPSSSPSNIPRQDGDFFPLNVSTPVVRFRKSNTNWSSPRGRYSNTGAGSGRGYYGNNIRSSRSYFHNQCSPYKNFSMDSSGPKRDYKKHAHRNVDISEYVDMESFLEDPWKKLEDFRATQKNDNDDNNHSIDIVEKKPDLCIDPNEIYNNIDDINTAHVDGSIEMQSINISEALNT